MMLRKVFLNKKTGQMSITLPKKMFNDAKVPKFVKIDEGQFEW